MNLSRETLENLLKLAKSTSNVDEINELKYHPSMNVRRALAKNINIDINTIECLYNDPVENVSYIASLHPKSNFDKKCFDKNLRPCVTCENEEHNLYCIDCKEIEGHKF